MGSLSWNIAENPPCPSEPGTYQGRLMKGGFCQKDLEVEKTLRWLCRTTGVAKGGSSYAAGISTSEEF